MAAAWQPAPRRRDAVACRAVAGEQVNIHAPVFDEPRDRDGFRARRARVGRQAGARRLGASLWEIPPGEAAYPYHLHLGEEEMIVVVDGRPSLRTPSGWRELERGEVVAFPRGREGAHQVANRGAEPARFLSISTNGEPDIVLYPDSDTMGCSERLPGDGGFTATFRLADRADYWDGETPPDPAG